MRNEILGGSLPLPKEDEFIKHYPTVADVVIRMWASLWVHYCANKGSTSTIYWLEQAGAGNSREFLQCLKILVQGGWLIVETSDNFSSAMLNESKLLEHVSDEELTQVRFNNRFEKYLPYADTTTQNGKASVVANQKRTNRKLNRPGMEVGAKSQFQFDRKALARNLEAITEEANKGMKELLTKYPEMQSDEANYGEIVESIIDYLVDNEVTCNMGINNVDSRGRAIKSHLAKVMNPIGFKVARCLLVIPE
jgi:hypothetical protein